MAVTVDWPTGVITVNQADLTLITGTLYELDTDQFRKDLNALQAGEAGMPWPTTHVHNPTVTVAGVVIARTIEIIPPYSIQFLPSAAWSVRLVGSNNNFFDIEGGILIQNQVQVIPGNSAGLIQANLSVLELDVAAIKGDISTIQTSITAIEGDIVTVTTDIGTLQTDMATATKIMRNRKVTDNTTGVLTVYDDDDTTPWLTANLWESADTSQVYRGQGLQHQERLT